MYEPFRLVDATSKLIEILEKNGICDEFLSQMKIMIEANKYKIMTDKVLIVEIKNEIEIY